MKLPFLAQMKAAGLPEPVTEYSFHPTRRWAFDYAWIAMRLAVEVEGQHGKRNGKWVYGGGRHNRPDGFRKDVDKYNSAVLLGWRLIRVTTEMVRDGSALKVIEEAIQTFSLNK